MCLLIISADRKKNYVILSNGLVTNNFTEIQFTEHVWACIL